MPARRHGLARWRPNPAWFGPSKKGRRGGRLGCRPAAARPPQTPSRLLAGPDCRPSAPAPPCVAPSAAPGLAVLRLRLPFSCSPVRACPHACRCCRPPDSFRDVGRRARGWAPPWALPRVEGWRAPLVEEERAPQAPLRVPPMLHPWPPLMVHLKWSRC